MNKNEAFARVAIDARFAARDRGTPGAVLRFLKSNGRDVRFLNCESEDFRR